MRSRDGDGDGDRRPVVASVAPAMAPAMRVARSDGARDDARSAPARVFCAEDDEQLSALQHMAAGAAAGMNEHLLMFPVDTLKTRMQSYVALRDGGGARAGVLGAARSLVATQGARALWRGAGAVAVSAGPAHALHFATYEASRDALTTARARARDDARPVETAAAGACATVVSDALMAPLDVVKQRMQLSGRETYASVAQCVRQVYEFHGVRAFYAGYKATLLMNVPFTASYFATYESAKHALLAWGGGGGGGVHGETARQFDVRAHCAAGALAGGVAAAATNPLDVVKTRLQTQGEVGARRYGGMSEALRAIAREEGAAGLLRGVRARVLFHVPAAAICWTTYEFCKHVMALDAGGGGGDGDGGVARAA